MNLDKHVFHLMPLMRILVMELMVLNFKNGLKKIFLSKEKNHLRDNLKMWKKINVNNQQNHSAYTILQISIKHYLGKSITRNLDIPQLKEKSINLEFKYNEIVTM